MSIRTRLSFTMPFDSALGDIFDLILCDGLIQAGKRYAIADAVYFLSSNFPVFNRNSAINAVF